ncbi:ABC transporter ATP-binding protein [Halorientalis brevis]|uniref:ABC transporter ATP-binding protein n=1 Tax=Halorientalis brevis TaxID=1126241 RepID=A0ABD6C9X4_9EURY|nr:ABC transporter ATP-binding protein [Halorientalis brevis]
MPALQTTALTKTFGERKRFSPLGRRTQSDGVLAVDDLDLTVDDGEVFGFLGPNGAGKSTTINMLLGFIHPTSGSAEVLGHDVTENSTALRSRLGLLPEGFDLYENLTGREHVQSAIETKGADDDPDAIIDRVGLDPEDARRAAGGYSKGMAQRLALGIALVGEPDLLLLDEPSSGLDPKGIKLLRTIVREEADRGATVFFSSHALGQVQKVCDRVGIMADGEMVAVDAIDDLREQLGTGAVVEATVADVPDLDPLRALDAVREVSVADDVVRITCDAPETKMTALRRLDDATTVNDVAIEDASLEALFEEYTSQEAATADAEPAVVPATGGDD